MKVRKAGALSLALLMGCAYAPRHTLAPDSTARTRWYEVDVVEPGAVPTRPVLLSREAYQHALRQLAPGIHMEGTPEESARRLLQVGEEGEWLAEVYRGRVYTLVPMERGALVSEEAEALRREYLQWCEGRGGGDCQGLLTDGPYLQTDDRRTLALALAFGPVLDETREALKGQVLNVSAVVSTLVWALALYLTTLVVPELASKGVAAALTVLLTAWLGWDAVQGLVGGWIELANAAHHARTFGELRAAGDTYAKAIGEEAARAMVLAVAALSGRTLGEVASRVRMLPGYTQAVAQGASQGVRVEVALEALAAEEALVAAEVVAQEATLVTVATAEGALVVTALMKKGGGGGKAAPGGSSVTVVVRHRGGHQQVVLSNGQRWHIPQGKSPRDIPMDDPVGEQLQEAVTQAARRWDPSRLTFKERDAIAKAREKGEYWLAHLLEREARGRYVEAQVYARYKHLYDWSRNKGIDVIDPATGYRYEILSGTKSNLARHGRRMAGELFRMLTF